MRRLVQHNFFYPAILLLICLIICFLNYTPNTFLTGWDTLHPEFNFSTNIFRLISGVWRSDQGLGAVTAHSHMSDLPRVLFLYLLHFFLPLSFLRYSYIFLCLIIGTISSFFLIKYLFNKKELAFIGGLFYLFNLSTLQQFIVPFEMFCTQYAFLPLILLFTLQYLQFSNKHYLLILGMVTILATPQAYAAHLWYAFFAIYLSFLIVYFLLQRNKKTLKKILVIIVITLTLNSFWLLPNLFYIRTSSSIAKDYKHNRLDSQNYLLKNRETGNIIDSSIQKGFYFNWEIFNFSTQKNEKMLAIWTDFISTFEYKVIAYTIFISSLLGLIISLVKKDKSFIPFSVFFIIPFILLNNKTIPFSYLFDFLIKNPTLNEAFRFIFNKLTTLYQLGILIYFIYFLNFIFIHRINFNKKFFIFISLSIIFTGIPFFKGQLIHPYLRQNIPQKYFELYDFLDQQPNGRVLTLPIHQPTGWQYYNWGYQGSGFIWFGSQNSFLDRDSDRWSLYNDNSFQEIYNAVYSNNHLKLIQSCQKYQIEYLLLDQDNISTSTKNTDQITMKNEISSMIDNLIDKNIINKIFNQNNLTLYKINTNSLIYTQDINTNILPTSNSQSFDFAYQKFSDYTNSSVQNSLYFPFREIIDHQTNQIDLNKLSLNFIDNLWQISFPSSKYKLIYFPELSSSEPNIVANLSITPSEKDFTFNFEVPLFAEIKDQLTLNFTIPRKRSTNEIFFNNYQLNFDPDNNQTQNLGFFPIFTQERNTINDELIHFGFDQIVNPSNITPISFSGLNLFSSDLGKFNHSSEIVNIDNKISLFSQNTTNSINIPLKNLSHSFGYILAIKSQYVTGIPIRICLKNNYSDKCLFEDEISKNKQEQWNYFIIPSFDNNTDYNLELNSISQSKFLSQSVISQVSIIPLPYQYLSQIYYFDFSPESLSNSSKRDLSYKQTGTFLYKIKSNQDLNHQVILSQAYNSGWVAFYFNGIRPIFLKNHFLVNNWANGWEITSKISKSPLNIYIFFWPQIFEFLGFVFLIPLFIWLCKKSKNSTI